MAHLKQCAKALITGGSIATEDVRICMEEIMSGSAPPALVATYLTALKASEKGGAGSPDMIAACADVMLEHAVPFEGVNYPSSNPQPTADIVGTGGDGMDTFNVSTCGGLVMAACGVTVSKHGNRSSSGNVGSADFLQSLGAEIMLDSAATSAVLKRCGFCFLFSQKFHPAMKNVAPIRKQMGIPTVFNVLGPLTNPAKPEFQLLGVGKVELGPVYAELMQKRGRAALVVHSTDGIDEISIAAPTKVWEVSGDPLQVKTYEISPSDFGIETHALEHVTGGSAEERVLSFKEVLNGKRSAIRDFIVINAAAGLKAAGVANDFLSASKIVQNAIDTSAVKKLVEEYVQATHLAAKDMVAASMIIPAAVSNFTETGKKIVCVGKNYVAHIKEMSQSGTAASSRPLWTNDSKPKEPTLFLKPTTSYVTEGNLIKLPSVGEIHHELELALVIGKKCKNVREDNALDVVGGYALALDITARDIQLDAKERGMPWTISKGYDGFCPVSAFIPKSSVSDAQSLDMWLKINGNEVQRGNTKMMIHSISKLIAYISSIFTLEIGDVILTGTPEGVGPIKPGDKLCAGIEGVVQMEFDIDSE